MLEKTKVLGRVRLHWLVKSTLLSSTLISRKGAIVCDVIVKIAAMPKLKH